LKKNLDEKTGWMKIMLLKYKKYLELPQVQTVSLYYFDEAVLDSALSLSCLTVFLYITLF
jgi:hypothetical protein